MFGRFIADLLLMLPVFEAKANAIGHIPVAYTLHGLAGSKVMGFSVYIAWLSKLLRCLSFKLQMIM